MIRGPFLKGRSAMKHAPRVSPPRCRCGNLKAHDWHLLCQACWARLPVDLQDEVWNAYREQRGSERHTAAMRAAIEFLRRQP